MQKQTMFQSFLKKKQLISQMLTETKSLTQKDHFQHFEALSEPVYLKAQSNAIYLTHLNKEFKDHLREFVQERESYNHTVFQLAKITEALEEDKTQVETEYKKIRTELNELQLDKEILNDKNVFHLDKILSLQEQDKNLELLAEQHEKTATELEEQIEYEKCILSEIQARNTQIISNLEVKTIQIEQATLKMQTTQKSIRQQKSSISKVSQDIKGLYYTLQAQDESLSQLCTSIEDGLNVQNNIINDIEFAKNKLAHVTEETHLAKGQLLKAEETQSALLNYEDDLKFEVRRVNKQLEIQTQAIDQEHWKIQQQHHRLQQNSAMLVDLQYYLQNLMQKNHLLQQSLEQQIIQDHTIKKIVDSKMHQPVGRKTKMFLQDYEEKELAETSTSWKENNSQLRESRGVTGTRGMTGIVRQRKQLAEREVNRMGRRGPEQMEFVVQKFEKSPQKHEMRQWEQQQYQTQQHMDHWGTNLDHWGANQQINTTGFTYIDRLARFKAGV